MKHINYYEFCEKNNKIFYLKNMQVNPLSLKVTCNVILPSLLLFNHNNGIKNTVVNIIVNRSKFAVTSPLSSGKSWQCGCAFQSRDRASLSYRDPSLYVLCIL